MKHILVVEDDTAIAFGLQLDLQGEGYDVEIESDGARALQRARTEAFDLILLDVMLPGKDGFEVCHELRRGGSKTPVIMLTAQGHTANIFEAKRMRVVDFLIKPFTREEILNAVGKVL